MHAGDTLLKTEIGDLVRLGIYIRKVHLHGDTYQKTEFGHYALEAASGEIPLKTVSEISEYGDTI